MLSKPTTDRLVEILRKDVSRPLRMKVEGFPKVYYCSFLLRDENWFETWASCGSVHKRKSGQDRNVYCDLRVGSYKYDQVANGGLKEHDEDLDSNNYTTVPIDDGNYDGLRMALWRLTEAKFREAILDFNERISAKISKVDPNSQLKSFTSLARITSRKVSHPEEVDQEKWVNYCKKVSKWINSLDGLTSGWVEFESSQETRIFVNTENSVIVQHSQIFCLSATLKKLTRDGVNLEQNVVFNTGSQSELPKAEKFERMIEVKHHHLMNLAKAKRLHSFSGPVLLYPKPAGVLIHEALGHRIEGSRLLSTAEGQTLKNQVGKKILNVPLTIRDNPRLRKFDDKHCIGAYDFDDEGTPAQDTLLVEAGILRNFLNTRAPLTPSGHILNGHARNKGEQRPVSRMAVTVIDSQETCNILELRKRLLLEIKSQRKPFGLIVYETSGGETGTDSYDFQAFSGEISYATMIFPDGREKVIRGVNFIGTPLQSLNNIIASGNVKEINNGFCGAESGFIPITTISPAILLSELELHSKEEELSTPYILPKPKIK